MARLRAAQAASPQSLVEAFSEVARRVRSSEDYEGTLRLITETAARAIAGCEAVSLTLLERSGPLAPPTSTNRR